MYGWVFAAPAWGREGRRVCVYVISIETQWARGDDQKQEPTRKGEKDIQLGPIYTGKPISHHTHRKGKKEEEGEDVAIAQK